MPGFINKATHDATRELFQYKSISYKISISKKAMRNVGFMIMLSIL